MLRSVARAVALSEPCSGSSPVFLAMSASCSRKQGEPARLRCASPLLGTDLISGRVGPREEVPSYREPARVGDLRGLRPGVVRDRVVERLLEVERPPINRVEEVEEE